MKEKPETTCQSVVCAHGRHGQVLPVPRRGAALTLALGRGVLLLVLGLVQVATACGSEETREAVVTAYRAHVARLRSILVDYTGETHISGEVVLDLRASELYDMQPDQPGYTARHRVDYSRKNLQNGNRDREITADSGGIVRRLAANESVAPIEYSGYVYPATRKFTTSSWMLAVYPTPGYLMDALFDQCDVTGPVEWEGKQVYAISAYYGDPNTSSKPHNFTIYVAPAHDYALCYAELRKDDGSVVRSVKVEDMVQTSGIWLPAKVVNTNNIIGHTYVLSAIEYKRVNEPLAAPDFELEFPPGTFVEDRVVNTEYTVPGAEDADVSALQGELDRMVAQAVDVPVHPAAPPAPRSSTPAEDEPGKSGVGQAGASALWFYVGLGTASAVVALAATLLALKLRR